MYHWFAKATLAFFLLFACAAGARAQLPPQDEPTTVTVRFLSKHGYQIDIWVDGKRIGYPPHQVELLTGKHVVTAGHMDLVPTLQLVEVVSNPGQIQTIILDNVELDQENFEAATTKLVRSIGAMPRNPHLPVLAAALTRDEADFRSLLARIHPSLRELPMVRLTLAKWAIKLDRLEEANDILDKLIEEFPTLAGAWQLKARALIIAGEYEAALAAGNKAVACEAANPYGFIARGDAYNLMNDKYNARLEYERALELHPGNLRAIEGLKQSHENTR